MNIEPRQVLLAVTIAGMGGSVAVILLAVWKKRMEATASIAPLTWLIHGMIFTAVALSQQAHVPTELLTNWSVVLRLQAVFTVLFSAVIVLWRNGNNT